MKLTTIMSLLVSVCATQAYAQNRSEVFYQPKGGAQSIELGYTMGSGTYEAKNAAGVKTSETKIENSLIDFTYLYGLSDTLALGVSLDNGTNKSTVDSVTAGVADVEGKATGMSDLGLEVRGNNDMGGTLLRYGGVLGFSPGNRTEPATGDYNRYSGGMSLAPYVAAEMGDANMHYGLGLRYTYRMTRKVDSGTPSTTVDVTGGNTLDVIPYFEMMAGPGLLSLSLTLSSTGAGEAKVGAATADIEASSYTSLGVDYAWDATPAFTLIGSLDYGMYKQNRAVGSFTDMNRMDLGVSGRFTF